MHPFCWIPNTVIILVERISPATNAINYFVKKLQAPLCGELLQPPQGLRRLSYLSLVFSRTLHSDGYIFPFLFFLSLLFFFSFAVCRAYSDNHFAFLHFFFFGMVRPPPPVKCYKPPSIVLQVLCLPDLIPWIYFSSPLYNLKGFDLGHTWMA